MRLLPTRPPARTLSGLVGASLVVAAAIAPSPGHASSFPCFDSEAMQSARIHDLKVNLMVNALKCREANAATLRQFGQLLERRSGEFAGHELAVQRSLEDRFGSYEARALFDDYETRVGNYHSGSQPSIEQCEDTAAFIRLAGRADTAELETLSRLVTSRGIASCPLERAPAPGLAMRDPPRPEAMEPTPEMVDGIPTYSTPGTGPVSTPEPLERVAVNPGSDPADETGDERKTRLAEAISALDAAAAALRGMQASDEDAGR